MACLWRKESSGIWCITYRENGKQKVRSLRTSNKREAVRLQREIEILLGEEKTAEVAVVEKPRGEDRNPTAEEFWPEFLKWAEMHRARATVDEYKNWFPRFKEFLELDRLGDATENDVETFKLRLLTQGKNKPENVGIEKVSINSALKTLSSIWNHARKLGLYTGANPFANVERFSLPKKAERSYLDSNEVSALLEAAQRYADEKYIRTTEAQNVYLAIALMALAGLRKREACFARWEWVDLENRILTVMNSDDFTTKNKQMRRISLNSCLVEILGTFNKESGFILEPVRADEAKARYRADFKKAFQRVGKIAGVRATPHDLRHSFASRHAVAGTSLHVIAGWLGHSTTWITQRYAHFQQSYNKAADNI